MRGVTRQALRRAIDVFRPRNDHARSLSSSSSSSKVVDVRPSSSLFTNDAATAHNTSLSAHVRDKTASFAMSGCGWLTVFYYGVIDKMRAEGYLTDHSMLAGTSGGALGALIGVSGLSGKEGLQLAIEMSLDRSFRRNIDLGLKKLLPTILPDDIAARCESRLHVCVTKVWQPGPRLRDPADWAAPLIISKFKNKTELVDTVAASCYIPLYSSRRLYTKIDGQAGLFVDGGFFGGFMPPIGDVTVSPFAVRAFFARRPPQITIRTGRGAPFSNARLLSWVLNPAPPDVLEALYREGHTAAAEWIKLKEENAAEVSAGGGGVFHLPTRPSR